MKICIAGAGAGKTTTMASRIVELREKTENYKNIFCITFTNNAVMCIKEKLLLHYGEIPNNIVVCTIHSFLYSEFVKPYYFLLYGKQYAHISVAKLPQEAKYKNGKIKRLENRDILHQTVIPERAKWVIYQKSKDTKSIKEKRSVIQNQFLKYCGAVCIDEAQDIDSDMQIIIETLHKMGVPLLMMGDPKQDLKGHRCLRNLVDKYSENVEYIDVCHRCPEIHLKISNLLVNDNEKQVPEKNSGSLVVEFESEKTCRELIHDNAYDLSYISKKQGKYHTHEQDKQDHLLLALAEEIEVIIRANHVQLSEITVKRCSYYYAEKLIDANTKTNDRQKALNETFRREQIGKTHYGILINMLEEKETILTEDAVIVNSIDSIKGQEGENCLFILSTDLAAYLFGNKKEETITKNKLYVALTRSLDRLTIFITNEVETKYGKKKILDFFSEKKVGRR